MNILAIDTSSELATVAIEAFGEHYSEEQEGFRQHAQLLLPMVERLLQRAEISFRELNGIAFGRGPGSFTGLRIACSVAKGLAYAHDLPLYPVSSLAAINNEVQQVAPYSHVLAMMDARMHQVYWGYFHKGVLQGNEQVSAPFDILLPEVSSILLAGVGYEAYLPILPPTLQQNIVKYSSAFPKASAMIRLVQSGQINPVSAAEALPVYVRDQVTQGEK